MNLTRQERAVLSAAATNYVRTVGNGQQGWRYHALRTLRARREHLDVEDLRRLQRLLTELADPMPPHDVLSEDVRVAARFALLLVELERTRRRLLVLEERLGLPAEPGEEKSE